MESIQVQSLVASSSMSHLHIGLKANNFPSPHPCLSDCPLSNALWEDVHVSGKMLIAHAPKRETQLRWAENRNIFS